MNNKIKQQDKDCLEQETLDKARLLFKKNANEKFYCKDLASHLKVHARTVINRLQGNPEIYQYMLKPKEARAKARLEPQKKVNVASYSTIIKRNPKARKHLTEYQIYRLQQVATCPATRNRCKALIEA